MRLQDKVAIITGASSGIGAALAVLMVKEGACVTIVARNSHKLKETLKRCDAIEAKRTLPVIADVSEEKLCEKIVKETIRRFGKLDILVNNAGIGRLSIIRDKSCLEDFDIIMRTNVRAVIYLMHLCIPHLTKTKGNIVNISSVVAYRCYENFWAYCASKSALDHLTRCMAGELGKDGIRVNTVNPGPVKTDFHGKMGLTEEQVDNHLDNLKSGTALGRVIEAEETAKVIVFVCSDDASSVTGANYLADNGLFVK